MNSLFTSLFLVFIFVLNTSFVSLSDELFAESMLYIAVHPDNSSATAVSLEKRKAYRRLDDLDFFESRQIDLLFCFGEKSLLSPHLATLFRELPHPKKTSFIAIEEGEIQRNVSEIKWDSLCIPSVYIVKTQMGKCFRLHFVEKTEKYIKIKVRTV